MKGTEEKNKKLSEKQKRFCEEYLIHLNGTKAAISAGYSARSATTTASDLLTYANVQGYLQELREKQKERTGITADRVLNELAKIAFSDVKRYLTDGNRIASVIGMSDEISPAIMEVRSETRLMGEQPVEFTRFKLHDKIGALTLIGKHLGMFNEQATIPDEIKISITRRTINSKDDINKK